ncbi:MAG: cation transporter [Agathobacter sp.]|nr:cation transporter [Agathobacter sp.]
MKKKFKVENLDCAHCAAKMEEAIKKIPGVEDAVMNFMMQKLTLEISDDADMNDILDKAQEAISKVSIVCEIIR